MTKIAEQTIDVKFKSDKGSLNQIGKNIQSMGLKTASNLQKTVDNFNKAITKVHGKNVSFQKRGQLLTELGIPEDARRFLLLNNEMIEAYQKVTKKAKTPKKQSLSQEAHRYNQWQETERIIRESNPEFSEEEVSKKLTRYGFTKEERKKLKADEKNIKTYNKLNKASTDLTKGFTKLGKVLGVGTAVGVVGAVGSSIYKRTASVGSNKITYSGYSKALRETFDILSGGAENLDSFFGSMYGKKERIFAGLESPEFIGQLARVTKDKNLVDSFLNDSTALFTQKMIEKSAKMSDVDAYNMFATLGLSPEIGMKMRKSAQSGKFEQTLLAQSLDEGTGEKLYEAGRKVKIGINEVLSLAGNALVDALEGNTVEDKIKGIQSNKALTESQKEELIGLIRQTQEVIEKQKEKGLWGNVKDVVSTWFSSKQGTIETKPTQISITNNINGEPSREQIDKTSDLTNNQINNVTRRNEER
jgi:hypothetical protein